MNGEKINVVIIEPGKLATVKCIESTLEGMQKVVNGNIEVYSPFSDGVCIVCNEEGKINGMRPNRAVYSEENKIIDIIFGAAFICDGKDENLGSLSEKQIEFYLNKFKLPERFYGTDKGIEAVPFEPNSKEKER